MNEIRKERQRPTHRRRRRRLAAILLPAALLGIAATGYVVLKSDQVVAAGIGCYDAADDGANVAVVSTTGQHPERVCAELWSHGDMGGPGRAPPMTACAGEGGGIHVFPSDEKGICLKLGFQDLPDGYARDAKRFILMRDALTDEMYEIATAGPATQRNACLSEEESLEVARRVLSQHGFEDWTAEAARGDYEGRECANAVAFEDSEKRVLIIPTFREDGIDPAPFGNH